MQQQYSTSPWRPTSSECIRVLVQNGSPPSWCACLFLHVSGVEGGITQDQLLANFRDDVWSNTCVMLLRFITSAEIKRRADHFEPFVVVSAALV